MTAAPRRTPLSFRDVNDVAAAIRDRGGRLTSTRRVMLAALFAADGPVSAEYIAGGLGGQMIETEVSSVYRNLEHLEALGVVRHVHVGHGPGLYTLEDDTQREYLVCERCGRVDSFDATRLDRIRAAIQETCGYTARFSHFPIVGLCARCTDDDEPSQAAPDAARTPVRDADASRHAQGDGDHNRHGNVSHHKDGAGTHDHIEHTHEHHHGDHIHAHDHVHPQHPDHDHVH